MRMLPAVVLATLLLAGCVPTPSPTPTPEPTATPVFASEEEALAAAEEAYGAYVAELDRALATLDDGGLDQFAEGEALDLATQSVANLAEKGQHQTGASIARVVELVHPGELLAGSDPAQIYACLDISNAHIVDGSGAQVDPPERPDVIPMLVSLNWDTERAVILIAEEEVWEGENFCV